MSDFTILDLPAHADARGMLVVIQDALPFDIKRVFWICDADRKVRAGHRNLRNREALVAVAGRVEVFMNDGRHRESVLLNRPTRCLLVEPEDWRSLSFGEGAVLLVLASEPYDPDDYLEEEYPE